MLFSGEGVTLFPNLNFLAKNENPSSRRDPIFFQSLLSSDGSFHPLCPVGCSKAYLDTTSASKAFKIFVDPKNLQDLSLAKIRILLCQFIRLADPGSFPKSHDLRKVATSFAFFRSLSFSEICVLF